MVKLVKKDKIEKKVLDKITAEDALTILNILAKEDTVIAGRIERIALEYLSGVDIDDIAESVFFDLDHLAVEDVWDRSGSTRDGYVDPGDMAFQMFEDTLEPYLDELKKYQKLSMRADANNYCKGILKGIYRFGKESTSEYKDWAGDAPGEYFEYVHNEWEKSCKQQKDVKEVENYIKKHFSDW